MQRVKRIQGRGRHGRLSGGARPHEHHIWKALVQKCSNPRNREYKKYGGQGIRVCERWRAEDGFESFLADVGPQPFPGAGLRLLNPAGDYERDNVEWGYTRGHVITHDGRTMPLAAWAGELGLAASTLRGRLRRGLSIKAVLAPAPKRW